MTNRAPTLTRGENQVATSRYNQRREMARFVYRSLKICALRSRLKREHPLLFFFAWRTRKLTVSVVWLQPRVRAICAITTRAAISLALMRAELRNACSGVLRYNYPFFSLLSFFLSNLLYKFCLFIASLYFCEPLQNKLVLSTYKRRLIIARALSNDAAALSIKNILL